MSDRRLAELGYYLLAGGATSPASIVDEVRSGEALGLGTAFISERYNVKEAATLAGAAGTVSSEVRIATAATNHNTRHPAVTASHAMTMHKLTGGRYVLGLGRGVPVLQDAFGIPRITTAQLEDAAGLLRRLWHGEVILGHQGPAGSWPVLHLGSEFDEDIPLLLVAFGPETLKLGGRAFDHVVLHTFFSDETTSRAVRTVKEAAEQAGRDPDAVTVWSCLATVGDHLPEDVRLRKTVGRLAGYLQGYGDLMAATNGWDPAPLATFRADPVVGSFAGAIDQKATTEQLEHIATLLPDEWLTPTASGSPEQCVAAVDHQFGLGADAVILHGADPGELAPVVAAYRAAHGPPGRGLPAGT